MRHRFFAAAAVAAVLVLFLAQVQTRPAKASAAMRRVLYSTCSMGFRHRVLPLSREVMQFLARRSGYFRVTLTEDVRQINRRDLRRFDCVVFYTSGELPLSDEQKQALLDFVRSGHGFVGIHSASDTCYNWPEYGEMLGGYFDGHPWHQWVKINVEDTTHPATRHFGQSFWINDEIYQYKNFSRARVHVLLSLDNSSVDVNRSNHPVKDFPISWCRRYGKGRVFYTGLGHDRDVWLNPRFQRHLVNGICWAMGDLPGEATPSAG